MRLYKIKWTDEALYNLHNICKYIIYHFNNLVVSYKLHYKITNSVLRLQYFPKRNPDLSYYGIANKRYRRLRIGKFVIIYQIDNLNRRSIYSTYISFTSKLFKSNVN